MLDGKPLETLAVDDVTVSPSSLTILGAEDSELSSRRLQKLHPNISIILHTMHAAVIRSQGLPEGVSEVVMKGDPLVPRAIALLQAASLEHFERVMST
jgi:hypothetical protein